MSEFYDEIPMNYANEKTPNDDEFVGDGWSVRKRDDKYFFQYVSGELAGQLKEIEISEADFREAKAGNLSMDQLCIKYKVT